MWSGKENDNSGLQIQLYSYKPLLQAQYFTMDGLVFILYFCASIVLYTPKGLKDERDRRLYLNRIDYVLIDNSFEIAV